MHIFSYARWSDFRVAPSFNFSDVSNIDQRRIGVLGKTGSIAVRIGSYRRQRDRNAPAQYREASCPHLHKLSVFAVRIAELE
jgi:hypothetical protein